MCTQGYGTANELATDTCSNERKQGLRLANLRLTKTYDAIKTSIKHTTSCRSGWGVSKRERTPTVCPALQRRLPTLTLDYCCIDSTMVTVGAKRTLEVASALVRRGQCSQVQ